VETSVIFFSRYTQIYDSPIGYGDEDGGEMCMMILWRSPFLWHKIIGCGAHTHKVPLGKQMSQPAEI
jgi:hypothetical protein